MIVVKVEKVRVKVEDWGFRVKKGLLYFLKMNGIIFVCL